MRKSNRTKFKDKEVLTHDKLNQLISREELNDIFIDIYEGMLETLYTGKLSKEKQLRKEEIEYILNYFKTEDVLDAVENGIGQ